MKSCCDAQLSSDLLAEEFFRDFYLAAAKRSPAHVRFVGEGLGWLEQAIGRPAHVFDLTDARIDAMLRAVRENGFTRSRGLDLAKHLRRLARFAFDRGILSDKPCGRKRRYAGHDDPAVEGESLRWFFDNVYRAERLIGGTAVNVRDYTVTLRKLEAFRPGLMLADLSNSLAAQFLNSLLAAGLGPATVNNHRARLGAIWRAARHYGLVSEEPRMRKLKESRDPPDSWSEEELRRIVAAPLAMSWRRDYHGIDAGKWWHVAPPGRVLDRGTPQDFARRRTKIGRLGNRVAHDARRDPQEPSRPALSIGRRRDPGHPRDLVAGTKATLSLAGDRQLFLHHFPADSRGRRHSPVDPPLKRPAQDAPQRGNDGRGTPRPGGRQRAIGPFEPGGHGEALRRSCAASGT